MNRKFQILLLSFSLFVLYVPNSFAQAPAPSDPAAGGEPAADPDAPNAFVTGINNGITTIGNGINTVTTGIGSAATGTQNAINSVPGVGNFNVGSTNQDGLAIDASNIMNGGAIGISGGMGGLGGAFNLDVADLASGVGSLAGDLFSGFDTSAFSDAFSGIDLGGAGDLFSGAGSFIGGLFGGGGGGGFSGIANIFGGIRDAFRSLANGARDIFSSIRGVGGGGARGARANVRGGSGDLELTETARSRDTRNEEREVGRNSPGVTESATLVAEQRASGNDLKEAYDGWSSMNNVVPSSIIHDPMSRSGMLSKYPEPSFSSYHQEGRRLSLHMLNMSTDDEIRKTSMAVFQPLYDMELSFAGGETIRDRYLNLFQMVRTVSQLTLSYLDKTVAAGLATTDMHAKLHVSNHLLKNIGHATAKLANPEWSPVFRDHDDKVMHCLAALRFGENNGELPPYINLGTIGHADITVCQTTSSETDGNPAVLKCGEATETNAYDYCQCCAEMSLAVNGTGDASTTGGQNVFSLVERVFWGRSKPEEGEGSGPEVFRNVTGMVETFKTFYGDVIMLVNGIKVDTSFVPPKDSLSAVVTKIREGCIFPEFTTAGRAEDDSSTCSDGYNSIKYLKYGVCPSLKRILATWGPEGGAGREDLEIYFQEASYGGINLTARDIENILELDNLQGSLPLSDRANAFRWRPDPNGKMHRWIEAYCDAASASKVARVVHSHLAILEDHLSVNRLATVENKANIRGLVNRVARQMDLAEADARSAYQTQSQLFSIALESDRRRQANIGGAMQAGRNAADNRKILGQGGNFVHGPTSATTRATTGLPTVVP